MLESGVLESDVEVHVRQVACISGRAYRAESYAARAAWIAG